MATVLTKPQTNAAKVEAQLSQELAQVTSRIRVTDLLSGGLTLVALVLGYTLVAVLADKLFDLPPWARFTGLGVFLVALAAAGWFSVVRPLRSRINPRYAARKVEQTLADGKNAVINWVDLQDKNLPESVRAAVGAKAAEGVADAEVAGVAESRRVLVLLASVGLLVAGLAVFFLLVKSAPFFSLVNRAYNPFTTAGIATRTAITLEEPAGGDVTVTSGDSVTVRVTLAGSLPDTKSPERARLLVRYNPESEEFEEVDLEASGSKREFAVKLLPSVLQNGVRYRVAAGDARTAEFAVTVRTKPLLRDFAVKYEYPAYTRLETEATTDPRVEGYRGTQITLIAHANRPVKDARLTIEGLATPVAGVVSPETPEAVAFKFALEESSNYRVTWTASDGEVSESAAYPIRVLVDKAPDVAISLPKEEETALPADGLLKVDGVAADDFGLVSMTLRIRVTGASPVEAEPKNYRGGKSFRRPSDQSDPTTLDYKDSVKLSTLKTKAGVALKLDPGTVVEYWLEATDNCTVPAANVGKSKLQRVKIAPPPPPAEQPKKDQDQAERGQQEQDHNEKQDQQQGGEKRPPQQPRPDNVDKKPQEKPDKNPDAQAEPQEGQPQKGDNPKPGNNGKSTQGGNDPQPNPEKPPAMKPPEPGKNSDAAKPPESGNSGGDTTPPSKGVNQPPKPDKPTKGQDSAGSKGGDQNLQDQANKVNEALNEKQNQPGDARPPESNPESGEKPAGQPDAANTGQPKPKPGDATQPPDATAKPQPGGDGQPKPDATPAEGKPQGGKGEQPKSGASQPKGEPNPKSGNGEPEAKRETKPGQSGEPNASKEKPTPPDANVKPETGTKGDATKPMGDPQAGNGKPDPTKPEKGDPKAAKPPEAGASKGEPKQQPGDGSGEPEEKPGETAKPNEAGDGQPKSGGAKPQTPPRPGAAKPSPTPGDATKPQDAQRPKPGETPTDGGAGEAKPEGKPEPKTDPTAKPSSGGQPPKGGEKATEKPTSGSGGSGEKKLDPKELEQPVKDLKSGDPTKQQAAPDKLDQAMGKANREAAEAKAEQLEKDLKGDDVAKRNAARKEVEKMAKEAAKNGGKKPDDKQGEQADAKKGNGGTDQKGERADGKKAGGADGKKNDQVGEGKQPTADQIKEAQKLQDDLTSKDDATRIAAEKKVDDAVGKEQREKLQQDLQDAQSGDPAKADAAKKRLEQQAKAAQGGKSKGDPRGPGDRPSTPGDKLDDDPKNRRKTADLQLKNLEEAKKDAALQKKLGYTPEQYEQFLKDYAEMLKRQAAEAAKPETLPVPSEAGGPATIRVGSGASNQPLGKKPGGADTAGGGVGTAPPGYTEAQRRFAEEAAKLRKPDPKK